MRIEYHAQADGRAYMVRATYRGYSSVATRTTRHAASRAAIVGCMQVYRHGTETR